MTLCVPLSQFHQGKNKRHADLTKSSVDVYLKGGSITDVQMQALLDQFSKKKAFHLKFGPVRIKKEVVFKDHGVPNLIKALTFFVKDWVPKLTKERACYGINFHMQSVVSAFTGSTSRTYTCGPVRPWDRATC